MTFMRFEMCLEVHGGERYMRNDHQHAIISLNL